MKHFFITGSSSGIGKALTLTALKQGHKVTGISRRNVIQDPNYRHLAYDLSDYSNYRLINFNVSKKAEELVLINNAGWLGEVKPLKNIRPQNIETAYQINLIAPSILCKLFIEQTEGLDKNRTILNISSGAGKHPIPSWSTYCASKAGLDLFTRVLQMDHPDVRCFAISPGVVDTEMQEEIRQVGQQDFPEKQRFVEYKEKGELSNPKIVAAKLLSILNHPDSAPDCVFSLRDIKHFN